MTARARPPRRRVLVVTGSRAEFGLLRPVMVAIGKNKKLELRVCMAGEHLLGPALTWRDVAKEFRIDARVPMQRPSDHTRADHAAACGRGMAGFAATYKRIKPDWIVVLGDRIEAFAAASAASIAGIAVCHIHGGDRAEGIADEAMRHAITKMAHLHCAATKKSAVRIVRMGERKERVFVTGSPAIDGLAKIRAMDDAEAHKLGDPRCVVLMHPSGLAQPMDSDLGGLAVLAAWMMPPKEPPLGPIRNLGGARVMILEPNHDPGRDLLLKKMRKASAVSCRSPVVSHLSRPTFIALLKRLATKRRGVLIGNSSAGLIECAAIGLPVVNIGPRQNGRERAENIVNVRTLREMRALPRLVRKAGAMHKQLRPSERFGDGLAGTRIAGLLARIDPRVDGFVRKRIGY
jgi:UDP-hydrolysing UDP-N-acetyl-D-glucosamine 2-epimerase